MHYFEYLTSLTNLTYSYSMKLKFETFEVQIYNEQEQQQQIWTQQLLNIKVLADHLHHPEIRQLPTKEMFLRPTSLQSSDLTLD